MALWGANAEGLRPEGRVAGEYGAAAVGGNYGFLSFLTGFRDVYAGGKYKRPHLAGSSLSKMGRGRWLLRRGTLRNASGIYPFQLER